jgi:signal transduction histidine kinase/CheY-like chemotaxis protein
MTPAFPGGILAARRKVGPLRLGRTYTIALAAATFPILVFAATLLMRVADDERYALESSARIRVERLARDLDREIYGQIKALEILAGTDALRHDDLAAFYAEAYRYDQREPLWESVVLADAGTGRQLINTLRPFGTSLPSVGNRDDFEDVVRTRAPVVSGVSQREPVSGKNLVAIRVPVFQGDAVRYVLSAYIASERIQEILAASGVQPHWYGAIIDRQGLFIARTHDAAARIATPASQAVRHATAAGPEGFYQGRLIEGAADYTAYYTSPLTGWSIHLAMPAHEFESPLHRSFWIMAGIGIATVALSVLVMLVFLRMAAQQRRMEAKAQQSMRLQVLGQLTGGVAHDFNNLLTVMIGNAELARTHASGATARLLDGVLRAAARAENLTRQLLTFARRQPIRPVVIDLRKRLPKLLEMLQPSLRADIALGLDVDPALWPVEVDPGELEIALLNIAANARDAMPEGGRLDIRARNVTLGGRSGPGNLAGDFVAVEIADTGAGMSAETIERAFEPFFTTKEVGRGTGLGLSQVYGFAQQAGGTALLRSAPGAGTTVAVYLRRTTKPLVEESSGRHEPRPGRARSVLLVEDDPDVADVAAAMLSEIGYEVVRSERAQQALDLVARGEAHPDVVLTDIVMPDGMSGVELARRLRAGWPSLPIVLTTGYNLASGDPDIDLPVLKKPYKPAELAEMLERALDGEEHAGSSRTPLTTGAG